MNDIKKVQFDLLMVLLENDIIDETHFISEREHINTLEDVVNDLISEYEELVNGDSTREKPALNLAGVKNWMAISDAQPYSGDYYLVSDGRCVFIAYFNDMTQKWFNGEKRIYPLHWTFKPKPPCF